MAQGLEFTIKKIDELAAPTKGRAEYKDTKVPGLYLRVTAKGVKTFSFLGRVKGASRPERVTLGKFPAVKPEQARTRATQLAGEFAGGASIATAARERREELTLDELKDRYVEKHLRAKKKRLEHTEVHYRLYIGPAFGTKRLSEITGKQVTNWFEALPAKIVAKRAKDEAARLEKRLQYRQEVVARQGGRKRGPEPKPVTPKPSRVTGETTANRAVQVLRAMFNWAAKKGQRYFTGENPAKGDTMFAEVERERFLQPDELRPFFESLAAEANVTIRDCFMIQLLTGAREANCEEMRWTQVSIARAEWHIPKTKNGKAQTVPLVPEALQLLVARKEAAKAAGSISPFVFPSDKSKTGHIVNTAKAWKRVLNRAGLTDVRRHDLRRTLGSWQARTGASLVLIGKSLNHLDPNTAKIYGRLDLEPVRESVGRATSAMFQVAGVQPAPQVIPFPVNPATKTARKPASGTGK